MNVEKNAIYELSAVDTATTSNPPRYRCVGYYFELVQPNMHEDNDMIAGFDLKAIAFIRRKNVIKMSSLPKEVVVPTYFVAYKTNDKWAISLFKYESSDDFMNTSGYGSIAEHCFILKD